MTTLYQCAKCGEVFGPESAGALVKNLQLAAIDAVIPLQAIILSGRLNEFDPTTALAIRDAVVAVRKALMAFPEISSTN